METLAAISLVGSIVQFMDFVGKLISNSAQLYDSGKDVLPENAEIDTVVNHLTGLNGRIKDAATSTGDEELQKLCQSCSAVAQELLAALDKVRVNGERSKWKSIIKAVQNTWSKEDIVRLEKRLARFREVLNLQVAMNIRYASPTKYWPY